MRNFKNVLISCCFLAATLPLFAQEGPSPAWLSQQVKQYLLSEPAWGIGESEVQQLFIKDFYQSKQTGLYHLFLQQKHSGIGVEGVQVQAYLNHRGEVVLLHKNLEIGLSTRAKNAMPAISAQAAVGQAWETLIPETVFPDLVLPQLTGTEQPFSQLLPALLSEPLKGQLTWLPRPDKSIRLSWKTDLAPKGTDHWWVAWVDAQNGTVLQVYDRVTHCTFDSEYSDCAQSVAEVKASPAGIERTMTNGTYRIFPYPVESPIHGSRALVTDPHDLIASPFGWHDTNGASGAEYTITRGNNVYASEDRNDLDLPGYSPEGGSGLVFDFPFVQGQGPDTILDAAVTNLFFWNNLMHDVWYQYGFDEVSGNFQANNYNRGGLAEDFVNADAQDGSGTNNANFSTPEDGQNPRMQMYLWNPQGSNGVLALTVNSPAGIAGGYSTALASIGPQLTNTPITADVVLVNDGTTNPAEGCSALVNASSIAGKIALIDRGNCNFAAKITNAQNAGAIAVVIVQNTNGNPTTIGGNGAGITIPSVMISQADGNTLKANLPGVNATLLKAVNLNALDSDVDNVVIAHEYTHGISTRLTGGPATSCLFNDEQAGEGWSDWYGLVMTVEPNDNGVMPRGIGTYVQGQATSGGGIRPFRYSTDMSVNPATYDDIKTFSIPHGVGFVWASMIWDLYWNMVDEYGYDADLYQGSGGNNKAMAIINEGLKLQPCFPGFVDARNAVLKADEILYGGTNQCLIWKTFARRGLGYSADQKSSGSRSDGIEGYDLPPSCQPILYVEKTAIEDRIAAGSLVTYRLFVRNQTDSTLTGVVVRDTLAQGLTLVAGSSCPVVQNGNNLEFALGTMPPGVSTTCTFQAQVDPTYPVSFFYWDDNLETAANNYIVGSFQGTNVWRKDTGNARSANVSWFIPDMDGFNDHTLSMLVSVPLTANTVLSFWHRYETEPEYDGGVLEYLNNANGNWEDLGSVSVQNGYDVQNGYNADIRSNNPLGARRGFSGSSGTFIQSKFSLAQFAGASVALRFRFATDEAAGSIGWYIDDIAIADESLVHNQCLATSLEGESGFAENTFDVLVTAGATSITPENLLSGISLYPNPAGNQATVSWESASWQPEHIFIRNLVGQTLGEWQVNTQQTSQALALDALSSGMYLVELQGSKGKGTLKLMVLH